MSPQPSPLRRFPLEDLGETGSLLFGETSPSPLTIPTALIAKIWGQVEEGVRIVPRGGVEVGGLLVGPKPGGRGIVVDGIVPLSIEYAHGPCFQISASDFARIAVMVESVQVDPSKAVVGFYRSQTRSSEMFRESDREIVDAIKQKHMSFAADFRSYLVLTPVSKSEMSVCISMRNAEDGKDVHFTLCSNPFSVVQARSSVAEASLPAKPQVAPQLEASFVLGVQRKFFRRLRNALSALRPLLNEVVRALKAAGRPSKRLYALSGLLVLAAVVGVYLKTRPSQPVSSGVQQPLRMGFSANREGPVWKLSWDRGAMELMKPSGAVLAITDGRRNQQLKLTPADLTSGSIFYTPHGGDLIFSLQLDRGSTPIEEHIRVLDDRPSAQKSAERGPKTLPKNIAAQAKASPPSSTVPTELPPTTSSGNRAEIPVGPILSPSVRPNSASTKTKAASATFPSAASPPAVKPNYVGPIPVKSVPAPRPPDVDSTSLQIRVHVEIDARGKVTKATAIGVTTANSPLVSVTERAARSWQFDPAKIDGQPVPSELSILFLF